jgi:hypothetical protein
LSSFAELRDGSIMFRFGDEADFSTSSSAAAEAATGVDTSNEAAQEAAAAGQQVSEAADSSSEAVPDSSAADATGQQAAPVATAAEVSLPDDDPRTEDADAGGSQSQSIDKAQLQNLKVGHTHRLAAVEAALACSRDMCVLNAELCHGGGSGHDLFGSRPHCCGGCPS